MPGIESLSEKEMLNVIFIFIIVTAKYIVKLMFIRKEKNMY